VSIGRKQRLYKGGSWTANHDYHGFDLSRLRRLVDRLFAFPRVLNESNSKDSLLIVTLTRNRIFLMKVLIDITHPAFVHFFRIAVGKLQESGCEVLVTSRDKDVTCRLLDDYEISHSIISRSRRSSLGLLAEMLIRDCRLFSIARRFKPDVMLAANAVYASHVGRALGIPTVSFDFDDDAKIQQTIYFPFATRVYTDRSYQAFVGKKQRLYTGVFALAYLHPKYFRPDPKIRERLTLPERERIIICRLVSLTANHDLGHRGFAAEPLSLLLAELSKLATVLITSERSLPAHLEKFRLAVPPHCLHDVLAQASLCIGESPTLAIESAVLGIPAVYVGTRSVSYLNMLEEEFGLVHSLPDPKDCLSKSVSLLCDTETPTIYQERRRRYLNHADDLVEIILKAVAEFAQPTYRPKGEVVPPEPIM
jgi:uncharacterized protein